MALEVPWIRDAEVCFEHTGDLAEVYESGTVLTHERIEIPHLDRLSQLTCKQARNTRGPRDDQPGPSDPFKKMKHRALMAPIVPGLYPQHLLYALEKSPSAGVELQRILDQTDYTIRAQVKRLFPSYRWSTSQTTWRFAQQTDEWFHWDFYSSDQPYVRAFVNLDTKPRTWAIGPRLTDYCLDRGIQMKSGENLNGLAERTSYLLDRRKDAPLHVVDFPPGALWLVQSQLVAHRVIYGRRMYAVSLAYDRTSMANLVYSATGLAASIRAAA